MVVRMVTQLVGFPGGVISDAVTVDIVRTIVTVTARVRRVETKEHS